MSRNGKAKILSKSILEPSPLYHHGAIYIKNAKNIPMTAAIQNMNAINSVNTNTARVDTPKSHLNISQNISQKRCKNFIKVIPPEPL